MCPGAQQVLGGGRATTTAAGVGGEEKRASRCEIAGRRPAAAAAAAGSYSNLSPCTSSSAASKHPSRVALGPRRCRTGRLVCCFGPYKSSHWPGEVLQTGMPASSPCPALLWGTDVGGGRVVGCDRPRSIVCTSWPERGRGLDTSPDTSVSLRHGS